MSSLFLATAVLSSLVDVHSSFNYTCTEGAFKSDGAVAKLFDVSCMIVNNPHGFAELSSKATKLWKRPPTEIDTLEFSSAPGLLTTSHPKPGEQPPIVPQWDLTPAGCAFHGTAGASFTGKSKGSVFVPTRKQDIYWLQLDVADGRPGKQIYRTGIRHRHPPYTRQPDSEPGSRISIKYVSNYFLYTFAPSILLGADF
ncbi:hypothetical protein DL96DRAFT_1679343 [Flagelloscypha sp. PMI_526]|nr:hypothetical protein DL96DRAFT_1679343 [Flagelloscypha sp. PMI_526]